MCCCEKPTINGQPGYRWQPNDKPSVRKPDAPDLQESDKLLYDEPGRCGGSDCHSHHYRLVKNAGIYLLVRHGGGDERIYVDWQGRDREPSGLLKAMASVGDEHRYWMLNAIYRAHSHATREAATAEANRWRKAAAEKKIKTRKVRGENRAKVWIEA